MIVDHIGNTPLVRLGKIEEHFKLRSAVYAKLESRNPSGSVKDRAAAVMIQAAIKQGALSPGGSIVEATSGNMGISLAFISAAMGFSLTVVMPEGMSAERIAIMRAYGADVVLTPREKGMGGAIEMAEKIAADRGAYMPSQFTNRYNLLSHYEGTGPEIYRNMGGIVDIFVCGVGTGGTIGGVGRYLKEKIPSLKVVAVEPAESSVLSGGVSGVHGIQGIGAGFIPPLLNTELLDCVVAVSTERAIEMTDILTKKEGIFVGISSGASLAASLTVAKECENKNILTIFPDGGERYISLIG
jgi:cysteine synthase A